MLARKFCIACWTLVGFACAGWAAPLAGQGLSAEYAALSASDYLGEVKLLATVPSKKVFTEGPCCDRAGNVFFTNTEASQILRWNGRELTVFREDKNIANGLLFDSLGRLVACEGGTGRITRTEMQTGKIELLADSFGGHPLGGVNDLCFDNLGRIYFTSRVPNSDPALGNVNAVYRLDPDGKLARVTAAPEIHMPNGLATSPDDKTAYLVESDGREGRNRCILAFDLSPAGSWSNPRKLIDFYPGRSGDGMAVDCEGNLYVAAGLHKPRGTSETLATRPGIHIFSPSGKLLAFAGVPGDTITNCRFGSADLKSLYVTSGPGLYEIRTKIAGKASYRPGQ
jgi:gluconolactonase